MEEAEWERANRSTQMRMGWGTKHGVLGRKHSGGKESAHSHTKEEQSGRVNSERSEETAHSHTQEERSRECEEGETWGVGPQSHTGRAVQGVWRGRDLRRQPTVTHRKSSPGGVNRERPEESAHSHTQEERSRECEEGESPEGSAHSGHNWSQWWGCSRVRWLRGDVAKEAAVTRVTECPGKPWEEGFGC